MRLIRLRWLLCCLLLAAFAAAQGIPTPTQYFGFAMGADRKLARYDKIVAYFHDIARQSSRVKVVDLGPTTEGNPYVLVIVSSARTMAHLDHYRELERQLYFQGAAPTPAQRAAIFRDGKAVVVITNNIHSTEIGSSQMVVDAVYKLATGNSASTRKILDNDILLLIPSQNPDGQILVTNWYDKYLGTAQEGGPLPFLYQKYVGHDDNRDMYLFSQRETQMLGKLLWHDWFPSIWLDEHQQGMMGPRMFTMPATDPINPNVDPLIYRLNTIYGQSQAAALEAQGKTGIIFNATYTNYWEGALAWAGWWHNEVGLLTEAASVRIATPTMQTMAKPGAVPVAGPVAAVRNLAAYRAAYASPNAVLPPPTDINSRTEYPRPWMGGKWTLKDIVDYEMTATFALLQTAANRREELLHNIYGINARTVELGREGKLGFGDPQPSYAAIIPLAGQQDANEVRDLVAKLEEGGVEIRQAEAAFSNDGHDYPAGTFVIRFDQVFGRYAKDMLEKQVYPLVRRAPHAPAEAPYDVSAWSLGMQFGVKVAFAHTPLPPGLASTPVSAPGFHLAATHAGNGWRFAYTGVTGDEVINRLLDQGVSVHLAAASATAPATAAALASAAQWKRATAGFVIDDASLPASSGGWTVHHPRVGLYQSFTANMDEGWTRWVFDHYGLAYTTLHNADIDGGHLRSRFDAIVLPDQTEQSILKGNDSPMLPQAYRGGIGAAGWRALAAFVQHGGTLVAMGNATSLLVDKLPVGVKAVGQTLSRNQFFGPGSIVHLQVDTRNPVGLGMAASTWAYYINTPFFDVTNSFNSQTTNIVARFPNADVNASGWLRGGSYLFGRAAVVTVDMHPGKIVLFGIRPQHRAQTRATMPMLFDAVYWSTAQH
ncbi:MAG: M14 family zinc carboxypeptidase [Terriglobales bacterium]